MKALAITVVVMVLLVAAGFNEWLTSNHALPRTYFVMQAVRSASGTCTPRHDLERLCAWFSQLAVAPANERQSALERIGTGRARLCTAPVAELFGAIAGVALQDKARTLRDAVRDEKWHDDWRCPAMDAVWPAR